ncbi:hypothetical protein [Kitasatospora sp. NPDC092286]|uniref:hypothetical protein n=1 Tax=Kitasatospora sp. NPDC092286 TaxID=3364087 RepID=UPI0037F25884
MLRMNGPWRVTVIGKDADYDQRVVIRSPYGTNVLAGRVGAWFDVRDDEWTLALEHSWGAGWRPNVRVIPGPVSAGEGGLRSRIVRSKDVDWPGGDPTERNFVLRLDALESATVLTDAVRRTAGVVTDQRASAGRAALGPASASRIRTSSDPGPGTVGGQSTRPVETGREVGREAVRGVPAERTASARPW